MKQTIIFIALITACVFAQAQGGFFKVTPAAPTAAPAPIAQPVPVPAPAAQKMPSPTAPGAAPAPAAKPVAKAKPAPAPDPIGELNQNDKMAAEKGVAVLTPKPSTSSKPVDINKPSPAPAGPNLFCKREGGLSGELSSWNCMRKACILPGDYYEHPHCKAWMSTRQDREIAQ